MLGELGARALGKGPPAGAALPRGSAAEPGALSKRRGARAAAAAGAGPRRGGVVRALLYRRSCAGLARYARARAAAHARRALAARVAAALRREDAHAALREESLPPPAPPRWY
jgi:hypothetical protein